MERFKDGQVGLGLRKHDVTNLHPKVWAKYPDFLTGDTRGGGHTQPLQSDGPSEPRPSGRLGLHPAARRWDSEAYLTAEATEARSSGPRPGGSGHSVDPDVWPPALLAALLHLLAGRPLSSLPNPGLQRPAPRSGLTRPPRASFPLLKAPHKSPFPTGNWD